MQLRTSKPVASVTIIRMHGRRNPWYLPSNRSAARSHGGHLIAKAVKALGLVAILCTIGAARNAHAEPETGYSNVPFSAGEILKYKVKWGPVRLGTLEISQGRADSPDTVRYLLKMTGESAKGLPFIHVLFSDDAVLNPGSPGNWVFTSHEGLGQKGSTVYRSDSSSNDMSIVETVDGAVVHADLLPHKGPLYDVLGLLMLIRGLGASGREITAQTVVEKQVRGTRLKFTDDVKEQESDAFSVPVRVRRFDGQGDWTCRSCAGMTGAFHGWLTDDGAAIPIEVAVKIGVGSVVLKLESYERSGKPGS